MSGTQETKVIAGLYPRVSTKNQSRFGRSLVEFPYESNNKQNMENKDNEVNK